MGDLPSGTVTLLFSDIEGSTVLLSRLGPGYVQALDGQRMVLRKAWVAHGGSEMGTEGDSFFVAFPTAASAVAAAVQAQRELDVYPWPGGERVRVRMGIHTGSPQVHDGGYVGMDVHRAARVAGAAHGGQVVVSEATAKLVGDHLPVDAGLLDLGVHQLKDLSRPDRLFQLTIGGLDSDFPPLKALGAASSLPRPATPLVGRDGELAELAALLSSPDVRLVTLTGPGGTGKTRLSIGLAQTLGRRFPDGVFFVPLAAVHSADVIWTTVSEVLGVSAEERAPPALFAHVRPRCALFVLDNLEQLSGAASVISQLLEAAPQVAVIATSRRPLHVAGEHEHPVPPLSLPDQADALNVEVSGAVQLFVQHAKMVRPSFSVTDSNRADVVQVCRSLDGLPLAIELAAARSKLLSPAALVVRLDGALDLKDAGVDRPARQQTLRAAIAWSYDLLTSEQQAFFREMGVFAGSAGLDAVAAVTKDRAGTDRLTLVADLVDASLARISEDLHGEPRVGLLATIRTFAQDQLRAAGELDRVCRRHAEHFVSIADDLLPLVRGGGADQLLEARRRFELELDNFRDALRWTLGSEAENDPPPRSQVETGWRLCGALGWLWADGGYQGESWRWLERAVSLAGQDDSPDLGRCLSGLAGDLVAAGSYNRALRVARQSVDMWRRLGDSWELGIALTRLAVSAMLIGDDQPAREAFEEAIDHANDTGDGWLMARAWCNLADFETREHNYERARYLCNLAIPVMRERGDELGVLRVALSQAQLSWTMGLLTDAHQQMRLLIPEATRLATGELLLGAAEILGVISADRGDYRPAARLLGASDALRERTEMPRDPITVADMQKSLGKARAALTSDEWTHEYQRGHGMSVENALMGTYVAAAPTFE